MSVSPSLGCPGCPLTGSVQVVQQWKNHTTISMSEQALLNNHEAVMMRIITIITLIYLPPTFASVC